MKISQITVWFIGISTFVKEVFEYSSEKEGDDNNRTRDATSSSMKQGSTCATVKLPGWEPLINSQMNNGESIT